MNNAYSGRSASVLDMGEVDGGLTAQLQDAAAAYVEQQILAELGMSGR